MMLTHSYYNWNADNKCFHEIGDEIEWPGGPNEWRPNILKYKKYWELAH